MKMGKKMLAVLLTIATLIGIFSCATTVFAEEYNEYADNKAYQETLLTEAVETEKENAEIICEVPEKRDEFSKTYKRSDGSFTTVFSKTPLHKLNDGEWEEINNTLKQSGETITNTDGAFDVEFPETINENEKITISAGDESITFSVNDVENASADIEAPQATEEDIIKSDLDKTVSQITYENVDDNTDIQYIVSSGCVKENIIVSNKESLKEAYSFDIEKGELSATLDNENNLIFKNDKNETIFTIPAPVMTDADNAVSYDIQVQVENADKAVLTLTYSPSKEWLESAKYPVVIDPVFVFGGVHGEFFEDTVIMNDSETPESRETNYVDSFEGYISNNSQRKSEVLVKFNMSKFDYLKSDNIEVTAVNTCFNGMVNQSNLLAKEINGSFDLNTVTYNDVYPQDNSEPVITYGETIDFFTGGAPEVDTSYITGVYFDITDIFLSWLNGEENNGFVIVPEDSSSDAMLYLNGHIYNSTGTQSFSFSAFFSIDYVDTSCSNDSYEYLSQEIGRAGTANVNTFSRSLSLSRSDLSMSGLRMPVDISLRYNTAYGNFINMYNCISVEDKITLPYGNKWMPSYCSCIFQISEKQHLFFTEEGTIVTFNEKIETITEGEGETQITTTQIIFEEDETSDSGYTLELIDQEGDVDISNMKITDPNGDTIYFNDVGFAVEVREEEPNADGTYDKISIFYDEETGLYIDYITDGIGRIYDFVYSSETGLLTEIKCLTAEDEAITAGTTDKELKVTYGYDSNGNLTSVTYPDGETVTYTYDSNGNLIKAQNIDGYNIQYTYDSLGKVTNIAEYAGSTPGNSIHLTQLSNRQVKVADDFSGTQTYQFGKDGRLHYTFDDKGNYLKSDYAPANDENVFSSNDWSISSQNLLNNGGFEETENGKAVNWSNSFNVEDIESSEAITDYACRVSSSEVTNALQSQTIAVNGGKTYTFSFYAKSNLSTATENNKLYMRITAMDKDENESPKAIQIVLTENFEQYSVTTTSETEITSVTVEFGLKNKSGDFYVNNAQLEKGYGIAPFNYIKNGSFNNSNENWSTAAIVDETLNAESVKAVKLSGGLPSYNDATLDDYVSAVTQNVEINGKKGETYSVGGWFKGYFDAGYNYDTSFASSLALMEPLTSSAAQLKVTYSYLDNEQQTVTENFVVDFAPYNYGWQYAVDTFALKGDTESVDVTVMTKNMLGDSYTTGITLEQDFECEVIEEEETDDSTEEICSCGCEDCYYGENCPCTGAIDNDCQCPECLRKETSTKDDFGNSLSNKSTDGINYIETLSSYTDDWNNLKTYTDENGNVVTYDYDTLNGILKSVTSSIGTANEITATSYTYDEMGKVLTVSTTVSNTENQSLQYVYTKDSLTEIITPNGKYRIIYDVWGQVRSVNVVTGSGEAETVIPLVEYTYNTGANRTQILTVVYKNSSTNRAEYEYEYYDDGTLKYVYLNKEIIHFVEYDNLGALESIENTGGRTVEYTDNGVNIYNAEDVLVYTSITGDDGLTTEENYGIKYKEHEPEYNYDSATGSSTNTTALDIAKYYRVEQAATTDWFGREDSHLTTIYDITEETETVSAETIGKISTEYEYPVANDGKTSSTIEKYINKTYNGDSESYRVYDGYYYEYDNQNKISAEKTLNADGTTTDKYSYEYDKLGQLIRFNDAVENKTYTYTYDNNGNILTKSEYAYTTGDLGTATNTTTYGYDTQWKDKLTTVGDKTIAYDNIGNPTSYLGATLTWEGRNLKSYETEEQKFQYEYDENGMRYRTTITNKEDKSVGYLDYVWVDSKLISISFTSDELNQSVKYLYDDFNEPVGFVSTREDGSVDTYYYLKNAQGDITSIVSAAGKKMVSFTYDVFGKRTVEYQANGSTTPSHIELLTQIKADLLNPFAYRGYCYDYDMGMYYLQSRYYDPNTGRFINADDTNYLNATGTVLGCNLFAYCENDPVNNVDPKGTVAISTIVGGLFGVAFAVLGFVLSEIVDNWGVLSKCVSYIGTYIKTQIKIKKVEFIVDVIFGAISGALSTTNMYKISSKVMDIVQSLYNSAKDGLTITETVISLILDLTISNLINTSQSFSKFNFKKVRSESKNIIKSLKKLPKTKLTSIAKLISNQIMYYFKSNKTLYKRYISKYTLQSSVSWIKSIAM